MTNPQTFTYQGHTVTITNRHKRCAVLDADGDRTGGYIERSGDDWHAYTGDATFKRLNGSRRSDHPSDPLTALRTVVEKTGKPLYGKDS